MPVLTALSVGVMTAAATLSGGAIALRLQSQLSMLFAFSGGVVLGVAMFDLLPEALALGRGAQSAMVIMTDVAGGFVGYLTLDRLTLMVRRPGHNVVFVAPAALTLHSAMDGLAIGLAFAVSAAAGLLVGIAVLAHDLVDGANTVALTFAGGGTSPAARRWLCLNALAPSAGLLVARLFGVPQQVLAHLLAIFAGGFLYIGAAELLPRSRQAGANWIRVLTTTLGLGLIYAVARVAPGS